MRELCDLQDAIFTLGVESPRPCTNLVRRMLNSHEDTVFLSRVCSVLGRDYFKIVFEDISPAQWTEIHAVQNSGPIHREGESQAVSPLLRFHELLHQECAQWDPEQDAAQWVDEFFSQENERIDNHLLSQPPEQIAHLSLYWTPEQRQNTLAILRPQISKKVLLASLRLNRLPLPVIRSNLCRWIHSLNCDPRPTPLVPKAVLEPPPLAMTLPRGLAALLDPAFDEALIRFLNNANSELKNQQGPSQSPLNDLPSENFPLLPMSN